MCKNLPCHYLIDMNNITNISLEAPSTPWDDYVVPNYTAFTTLVLCAVILGRLTFCVLDVVKLK